MTARKTSRFARLGLTLAALLATATVTLAAAPAQKAQATTYGNFGCGTSSGSVTVAKDIMAGYVVVGTYPRVYIGTGKINWAMDPFHNDAWRKPFLSLRWLYNLTQTYITVGGGHPEWLARARAIAADFAAAHPYGKGAFAGDVWNPMYTGIRAQQLACVQELSHVRVPSLATYGRWLTTTAHDPGNNNQGMSYALGILAAGCDTPNATWVSKASTRLTSLVSTVVDSEGVVREQSPGYGRNDANLLVGTQQHLRSCVGSAPAAIDSRVSKLLTFLAWDTAPSGLLTQLGDTQALAPPIAPEFPFAVGTDSEYAGTRGQTGTPPASTYALYHGGYVFGRSTWAPYTTATYYSLRFGPARTDHGHNDHMQLTLSALGHDLLVDSGFYGYSPVAYREFLRSPAAHNVLTVPGVTFDPKAATTITAGPSTDRAQSWLMTDRAYGGLARSRAVLVDLDLGLAVVRDIATRPTPGVLSQLWHLPPGAHVTGRISALAATADGKAQLHLIQVPRPNDPVPAASATVITGRTSPYQGWFSPLEGKKLAAPVVSMNRTGRYAHMLTVIAATAPGVSVFARYSDGILTVTIGSKVVHIRVPGPTMAEVP